MKGDSLDEYREEYNKILLEKATGANAIVQDKYITISVNKKNVEDARNYFARVGADLIAHFGRNLKRTTSKWATVTGESFFCVSTLLISRTVWWRS